LFLCAFPLAAQRPEKNPEDRAQFFHDINISPNGTANVVQCFGCNVHTRGHVTGEEIIAWARGKMAAYKVPTIVEFVESLPRSATGKIQWRVLQERENARTAP
jgi:acyl-CoA synthetase (AMP-forming)/AMP-acid ligase II